MEKPQPETIVQSVPRKEEEVSVPFPVKVISILMLLAGVLASGVGAIAILYSIRFAEYSAVVFFMGALPLVLGVITIVVSFGIRKMYRWALYLFTVSSVFSIGESLYGLLHSGSMDSGDLAFLVMQVIVLVYLWAIFKKFR